MTDTTPTSRGPARYSNGRFGPGNPGRPRGSRNRLPQRVAEGILTHFEGKGDELLDRLCRWFVPEYTRLVTRLLPRPAEAELGLDFEALDAAQTAAVVAAARAALARIEAGDGTLADLEAALAGAAGDGAGTVNNGESTVAEGEAAAQVTPVAPVGFVVS